MISANITKKASDIFDEVQRLQSGEITEKELKIGPEVERKSIQAILEGQGKLPDSTPGWIAYMSLFSTSEAELDRLIPRDGTIDDDRQKARAYLVANGRCGMGTTENLPTNVDTKLDLP
jgi:hypothetical protein